MFLLRIQSVDRLLSFRETLRAGVRERAFGSGGYMDIMLLDILVDPAVKCILF